MTPSGPLRVFLASAELLQAARDRLAAGDAALQPALDKLLAEADDALTQGPWSVMDKAAAAPSGDKHDYASLSTYAWPDDSAPGGLPWVQRDGRRNPECDRYDRPALAAMGQAVETLALAGWLTGRRALADRAAQLLRVWFCLPQTRMNPHLRYGQFVPGAAEGNWWGIIDTSVTLPRLIDAVGLLPACGAWTDDDQAGLADWLERYMTWLIESDLGRQEADALNNHAVYYDVQLAILALVLGETDLARRVLADVPRRRIHTQIEPDGRQPQELRRTRSLDYTTMNLRGFLDLAALARHVGIDLWRYESPDGRGIRKALDWLVPYMDGLRAWPYEQILPVDRSAFVPILRRAALAYGDDRYADVIARLPGVDAGAHRANLLHPRPAGSGS